MRRGTKPAPRVARANSRKTAPAARSLTVKSASPGTTVIATTPTRMVAMRIVPPGLVL